MEDVPQQCEGCRFAGMRLSDGFNECVTGCNGVSLQVFIIMLTILACVNTAVTFAP